jgi:hypothetical protein
MPLSGSGTGPVLRACQAALAPYRAIRLGHTSSECEGLKSDNLPAKGTRLCPYSGVLLRDDCKTDPSVKAIGREPVAVHREDPPDAFSLSHSDKCRVRETHQAVGLLDHELSFAGYVDQVEGEESHRSRQHLPDRFLGFWKIP